MVSPFENLGQSYVFVDRLEPFLNVLVLGFIEVLELLGLVRFFVQGNWTVPVSLPGRIRTYCLDLTVGLELRREAIRIIVIGVIWRLIFFVRRGSGRMARCGVILVEAGVGRFEGSTCRSLSRGSDG